MTELRRRVPVSDETSGADTLKHMSIPHPTRRCLPEPLGSAGAQTPCWGAGLCLAPHGLLLFAAAPLTYANPFLSNPGTYVSAAAAAAAAADAKLARGLLRTVRDRLASLSSIDDEQTEQSPQADERESASDEGMRVRTEAARRYRRARRTAWSAAEATLDNFRVAAKRAAAVQVRNRSTSAISIE